MNETTWKLFTSNEETINAVILACENAIESIELEQFIFIPDNFSNKLIEVCAKKASQGVRVRFIWDAAGSFSFFGSKIIEDFKKKGIELVFFKTLFPTFFDVPNYRSWYFRNHRRTIIIDEKIGFTGSICIWEKSREWRDTNVMVEGLVVKDMRRAFERMWDRAQGKKLAKIKNNRSIDHEFKYISNNPRPKHRRLYNHVIEAIRHAKKDIYIATPYFIPTHRLARVLKLAAHRNVNIKIIMPEWSNHSFVDLSARTFFYSMLKSGIKIYLHKGNMLHAKTMVIDEDWASVGTLNMDHVSLLYNFEANLITTNRKFASELISHFNTDLLNTEEITFDQWKKRYWVEKFAGFFLKFIRNFF